VSRLIYLLPLVVLILKRHAAAAMLLDAIGGPVPHWLLVALGLLFMVQVAVGFIVGFAVVLAWNSLTQRKRP